MRLHAVAVKCPFRLRAYSGVTLMRGAAGQQKKISKIDGERFNLKCDRNELVNFYSAIKSGDSETLDGGTSQLGSQRRYG